jgi:hypothetical protein
MKVCEKLYGLVIIVGFQCSLISIMVYAHEW